MQTLQQELKEGIPNIAAEICKEWRSRLVCDYPNQSAKTSQSIIRWLVGNDLERFEQLNSLQLALCKQAMVYRYNILKQRYLGVAPKQAYVHLTNRLGSLMLVRNKMRALCAFSNDRASTLVDILQEVIQELLQRDRYLQQQIASIAQCTDDTRVRTALLLATTEEYCLRPIRNQPLLMYRFVTYLRRKHQAGVTQVPAGSSLRLYSDELLTDDCENKYSFCDLQAVLLYQDTQTSEEKLATRQIVKQEFSSYLAEQLGADAVQWLKLYLQGKSPVAIADELNLSVQEVYRLREKVSYHAVRVFALKHQPELVSCWLETSLQEHGFGLTSQQWQQFWQKLTPRQRMVVELKKQGQSIEQIALGLNIKLNQAIDQWNRLCLIAHTLRNQSPRRF